MKSREKHPERSSKGAHPPSFLTYTGMEGPQARFSLQTGCALDNLLVPFSNFTHGETEAQRVLGSPAQFANFLVHLPGVKPRVES